MLMCVCALWVQGQLSDGLAPADAIDVILSVLWCPRSVSDHVPPTNVKRSATS